MEREKNYILNGNILKMWLETSLFLFHLLALSPFNVTHFFKSYYSQFVNIIRLVKESGITESQHDTQGLPFPSDKNRLRCASV